MKGRKKIESKIKQLFSVFFVVLILNSIFPASFQYFLQVFFCILKSLLRVLSYPSVSCRKKTWLLYKYTNSSEFPVWLKWSICYLFGEWRVLPYVHFYISIVVKMCSTLVCSQTHDVLFLSLYDIFSIVLFIPLWHFDVFTPEL